MNRQEFMSRLEYLLRGIPEEERADALAYYNDYFEEAGAENEYQVIQELGSPEQVAQTILSNVQQENCEHMRQDYGSPEAEWNHTKQNYSNEYDNSSERWSAQTVTEEKKKMSTSTKVLLIVVIILTFPLWIGVVAGLFGGLVGLLGGLFGVIVGFGATAIGFVAGGVGCIWVGITQFAMFPATALASVSVGAFMVSVGLLLALLCTMLVGVWIPKLVKAIVSWVKRIAHREEGGNEI